MMSGKSQLLPVLHITVDKLSKEFDQISSTRRDLLASLTNFIQLRTEQRLPVNLNFICTHNSRRSHIGQLWATAAAHYYGIQNIHCFSGGTEATAFNPRAVKAMREAGFSITLKKEGDNPLYEVRFAENADPIIVFSKRYDDAFNSSKDFAAVMTCSHADENCPVISGAIKRIALTYDDPKDFDGTPLEESKYSDRVNEIGREILYAFSQATSKEVRD